MTPTTNVPALPSNALRRRELMGQCDCACDCAFPPLSELTTLTALHALTSPPTAAPARQIAAPTLSAWLHLTDRCNLRCAYCYLPHQPADMSAEVAATALAAILRAASKYRYTQLKLKYAGGEPLLRPDFLLALHASAQAQAAHAGLELDGVVLSNGVLLTPALIRQLQAAALRLMISLDGLDAVHNGLRCDGQGNTSAAAVKQAIELALDSGLTPDISVTVSAQNIAGLPALVAWLAIRKLPFSLNFCRAAQPAATNDFLPVNQAALIAGLQAAYCVISDYLPQRSLLTSLLDHTNCAAPHRYPCSAGRDYLVIDPRGRIAQCQMIIDQPVTDVNAPDPLGVIRRSRQTLHNPPVEAKPACRACVWRYWCAGGCPLVAKRVAGNFAAASPHCQVYQTLLPEILRLEEQRLRVLP